MKVEAVIDTDISFKESVKRAREIIRQIEARNEELEREPLRKRKEIEQTRFV